MTKVKRAEKILYGMEDYSLVGCTEHLGTTTTSGHYLSYDAATSKKFNDNGGWKDPEVCGITKEELESATENGYVFLYRRVTNR